MRRCRQKICVVRDVHSSYTTASFVPDETASSLRSALLLNTAFLRSPTCTVRIDSASGFESLRTNTSLKDRGIILDFGYIKNKNSNSVVDKGIQELEAEFLKVGCSNVPVSDINLQSALDILNGRVRNRGLSAKEIIFQRDQHSLEQLNFSDLALSHDQREVRQKNNVSSAHSKAPGKSFAAGSDAKVGDLVFIKDERNKYKARDRYIVVSIDDKNAQLQKLTDKFMSKKYIVPLVKLYPASGPPSRLPYASYSPCDDDDEDCVYENDPHVDTLSYGESEEEMDVEGEDDDGNHINGAHQDVAPRPRRNRRPPAWVRSGEYVMDNMDSDSSDDA